ncbi:ligase-associated DNA damage response DEXH box helicase [Luteolibacter flavescens]|uniref:Ligase-associated DNA damage response DEXH box helicase n=1 Tax=Luteolibacter flavescens TaxID=1859460 RepID=A0ABT3FS87_9BACT|nr:ligase-associated DNA damage response DEXH box helicase [Luteolibacter flavescens]MCW1886448.1 ligase-associated DNA damage response DEXH box helicase [Luteolibacter flavescens]
MPADPLQPFFKQRGWKPFPFQKETWKAYAAGKSGLLHAPTGQGKTLAVWMGPVAGALKEQPEGCSVVWLTPLRALAQDTLRALREPLEVLAPKLQVEARTGDTSSSVKARLRKKLPFGLVTTPESLSLMLTHDDTREKLAGLRAVIVDEWHEMLGNKRGVQTELCLARLREWFPEIRIWGLSATLGNLDEARDVLLGSAAEGAVTVSADLKKEIVIDTLIPREIDRFPWSGHLGTRLAAQVVREVEKANSTLLFTNTRSQTELWFQELLSLRPDWAEVIAMHHGSVDREEREKVEQGLREGRLRCVVCTSSLDLGVDFSPVDQVLQVGSPKGIARLLQRAGRSGHQPGKVSRVLGVPTHAMELVEFAAARDAAHARHIEARRPLVKPLDVLVQHLVTCAIGEPFEPGEMLREILSTHAFRDLTDTEWDWCLGFISSGGRALAAYPRYRKARLENGRYIVDDKRLIQQHRMSIGTISADSHVSVRFANGQTLGTVEEGFISRLKQGQLFIFAGKKLELVRFHQRIATVRVAKRDAKGAVAMWGGNKMPLSNELAHAMAARLRGEGPASPEMKAVAPILEIQRRWSELPDDRTLLVEHTRSRDGEHLFVYPLAGRLVHEGLGALMAYRLRLNQTITVSQNDYGFCLTAKRGLHLSEDIIRLNLTVENLLEDVLACLNTAELARRQFHQVARVAGLILQQLPGRQQRGQRELQSSSRLLFEVLERYDPENLLLLQSQREILEKQLEFSRLHDSLIDIQKREVQLIETKNLTPMAFPLWAEQFFATMPAGDAATRLEQMLQDLEQAADK